MKIDNLKNRGFSRVSVFAVILIVAAGFLSVSCSGSDEKKVAAGKEITKSVEEISDSSMEFSGNIAQTTCLECHPEIKDGGFNIDFKKVKTSSVAHSKSMDEENKATGESEK